MEINGQKIGDGQPCFIMAEAGINHNGDLENARALIKTAAKAGCQAIKFQTFDVTQLLAPKTPMVAYQAQNTGVQQTQAEMLKTCQLDASAHRELIQVCKDEGITFISTPFDDGSLDLLIELDVPAIKISSGDLTNLPFLARASSTNRPIILSTGMGTMEEVKDAVDTIRSHGNGPLVLLHCVSNYPALPEECNLRAMTEMKALFGTTVGFSDHTLGYEITLAAVAMGAGFIEKHITLDRTLPGPDHKASLEPDELERMVSAVRQVEKALGDGVKQPSEAERETAKLARKSLHARRDIAKGEILDEEAISIKRPGTGLSPALYHKVIGKRAACDIPAESLIEWDMLT